MFKVLDNLSHDSRQYNPGDEIEIDDPSQAEALIGLGVLARIESEKTEKTKTPKEPRLDKKASPEPPGIKMPDSASVEV